MIKQLLTDRRGFSLVEILIVLVISTSVVLVVSNLAGNVSLLNGLVNTELQSKSDVTQTIQIMTTEIQSASPSANGSFPIDIANTSTFAFYDDVNHDGRIDRIRYFLSSSSIFKGDIQPTGTPATYPSATEIVSDIIDGIMVSSSTPLFTYYDSNYTGSQAPMAQPVVLANIRLVGINFMVSTTQPGQAVTTPQPFSSLINIRNLRSN